MNLTRVAVLKSFSVAVEWCYLPPPYFASPLKEAPNVHLAIRPNPACIHL